MSTDARFAVITIGIDPMIHLGPVTLAWHGLTIAIGILIGGLTARGDARPRPRSGAAADDRADPDRLVHTRS
jgi:prolipoprotein diacylglyceryltransferase